MTTVGLIGTGHMGAGLGWALREGGHEVVTTLDGRSARTARLTRDAGIALPELSVDGGLLRRYTVADDFGHMEAAFTVCTFWLVEALALIGRTDDARELFDRLLTLDNGLGLYSEDILPDTLEQSGNFPQTYTHVGLINAAFRLSRRWD